MTSTPSPPEPAPETADAPAPEPLKPKKRKKEKPPPRPVLVRLFGISIWGGVKLALWCVFVGFFVLAAQFDPREPDVAIGPAMAAIVSSAVQAAGWAIRNFWKPALAGAGIVLPLWVLWRLVSLPFRK
ncbi:MAG: hypothetical protein AAFQ21_09450 [Pseudomonadota bacterium]